MFMVFAAGITVFILSSLVDKDLQLIFGGCILLFFASFMIGFGSKCVEVKDNYQDSIYCGPGGEGGGIAMICIGCIMCLAGCATFVHGVDYVIHGHPTLFVF